MPVETGQFDVLGPDQARGPRTTFVGRRQELDLLVDVVSRAPSLVTVGGQAGVGKSRLVEQLLKHPALAGKRVLIGHCHSLREPFPLGPILEALSGLAEHPPERSALSSVAGALRPLLPELAGHLPSALEPLADSRSERHRIFRAVLDLLGALGPTVCVLEDLHWADDGTVELLRFLAVQLPEPVSVVATYRDEGQSRHYSPLGLTPQLPSRVTRIDVPLLPLDREELRELVSAMLDTERVSAEFAGYLHDRTGGLPFAVEELVHLLAARKDLVRRDGLWLRRALERLGVPSEIRAAILERLAHLSPDAQRTVEAVAVVGVPCTEALLTDVTALGADRTACGLTEALETAILRESESGEIDFHHALARQAVYEALPGPRRRGLHLRVAKASESGPPPLPLGQLAHHYRHADQPLKWVQYAEQAAERALSLHDETAAAQLLEDAVLVPESPAAARGRMAVALGKTASSGVRPTEAASVLRQLLDAELVPVELRGEIRLHLGLILADQAPDAAAGFAEVTRAVAELESRPALAARAMGVLAMPLSLTGHIDEHLQWLHRAVETAERAQDPDLRLAVLANRAAALIHVGDSVAWDAVGDVRASSQSSEERRQLLRAFCNLSYASDWTGHYGRAEAFLDTGRGEYADLNYPYAMSALDANAILLDWFTGRWAGLEERAEQLSRTWHDVPAILAGARLVLGGLLLARGELRHAEQCLGQAEQAAIHAQSVPELVAASAALTRILLIRSEPDAACERSGDTLALIRRKGMWTWAGDLLPTTVEALLAGDRPDDAESLVAEATEGTAHRDAPVVEPALSMCHGLLAEAKGSLRQAKDCFGGAERGWRALPRPYDTARARMAYGRAALAGGDASGPGQVRAALDLFRDLGAPWEAANAKQLLRRHGVTTPSRTGRRGYGISLSPREEEVARLAARGLTNREIADALVLSPRTVEQHVARAVHKLGVGSRHALTDPVVDATTGKDT